jgi:hypothetical protein
VGQLAAQVDEPPAPEISGHARWRHWHVPLLIATSVVLVITSVLVATREAHPARRDPGRGASARPGTPGASPTPPATGAIGAVPPSPRPSATPPLFRVGTVSVDADGFWSWALLDRRTGRLSGSSNKSSTTTTASMIKPWIAADYLRRAHERGATPSAARLADLSRMIRDSDNVVAEALFREIGRDASIYRLVSICRLSDSSPYQGYWSNTAVSARDTVRMGACLADGRAAGPAWTDWLVNEMRHVRVGDFGILPVLPEAVASRTAVKNGWLDRQSDHNWYVNCMAIVDDRWVLAVLTRYSDAVLGMGHGVDICSSVTRQLLAG